MDGDDMTAAIALEKKIKHRDRAWKLALIEKSNVEWRDLSLDFLDSATARGMTRENAHKSTPDIEIIKRKNGGTYEN